MRVYICVGRQPWSHLATPMQVREYFLLKIEVNFPDSSHHELHILIPLHPPSSVEFIALPRIVASGAYCLYLLVTSQPTVIRHVVASMPACNELYGFNIMLFRCKDGHLSFSASFNRCNVNRITHSSTPLQVIYVVGVLKERPVIPTACPPPLARLMHSCWQQDAAARPCFADILQVLKVC